MVFTDLLLSAQQSGRCGKRTVNCVKFISTIVTKIHSRDKKLLNLKSTKRCVMFHCSIDLGLTGTLLRWSVRPCRRSFVYFGRMCPHALYQLPGLSYLLSNSGLVFERRKRKKRTTFWKHAFSEKQISSKSQNCWRFFGLVVMIYHDHMPYPTNPT